MSNHGHVFLPIAPLRHDSPMLECEAWSQGDLEGLGYEALCSSSHIHMVSQLSSLLAGHLIFYNPREKRFKLKQGSPLLQGFTDNSLSEADQQALFQSIRDMIEHLHEGELDAALNSPLSHTSLDYKIERRYGFNNNTSSFSEAWTSFINYPGRAKPAAWLTSTSAAEFLARESIHVKTHNLPLQTAESFFWRDDQFWGLISSLGQEDEWFAVPLIQLAALNPSHGFDGFPGYTACITDKDLASLTDLILEMECQHLPVTTLFSSHCHDFVQSICDSVALEASTSHAVSSERHKFTMKAL